jgi:uncharacterized protein
VSLQQLRVDLREYPLKPGGKSERAYDLQIAPLILGGQRIEVLVDDGVTLVLERVAGGFLVTVRLVATIYGPCSRCLCELRMVTSAEEREFVPLHEEEYGETELSPFVDDLVVDVAGMAREALILSLPEKLLCREDCPGLCPVCGQELRKGQCGCAPAFSDPRWDKLRNLKLEE